MSPERESRYITAYLRRKLPHIARWDPAATVRWVQWYMRHGRISVVANRGRLAGVLLVRLVDNESQAVDSFADSNGRTIYVEACACEDGLMPVLFHQLRLSFPQADTISWVRSKRDNRRFVAPIERVAPRFRPSAIPQYAHN